MNGPFPFVCPECGAPGADAGVCQADGASLLPTDGDALLGQYVGSYRVARLLGQGGMGRVYKAVHPTIGSRVAIKVLSAACAENPNLVARFFSEARAANVIRHEGIVNVLDLASFPSGAPYIVMEYIDGAPLSSLIAHHAPFPLGGYATLIAEVLDALGAAHSHGIVHRDIKPDNVFVTANGRAKLLDFGIAKLRPDLSNIEGSTQTGALLGTPHYMSPEQARGLPADARSDLYSVGLLLFEGVTARRAFEGTQLFELLQGHIEGAPPEPRSLRHELPIEYQRVILKALAKAPEHRFATAQEFTTALREATQSLPADSWRAVAPIGAAPILPSPTPGGHATNGASPSTGPTAPSPGYGTVPLTPSHHGAAAAPTTTHGVIVGQGTPQSGGAAKYAIIGCATIVLAGIAALTLVLWKAMDDRQQVAARPASTASGKAGQPDGDSDSDSDSDGAVPGINLGNIPGLTPSAAGPSAGKGGFDIMGKLPEMRRLAGGHTKGPKLIGITINGLNEHGKVDLKSSIMNTASYRFLGSDKTCVVVMATALSMMATPSKGGCKNQVPIREPRCNPGVLLKRAKKSLGQTGGNAWTTVNYRGNKQGTPAWTITLGMLHTANYADDC